MEIQSEHVPRIMITSKHISKGIMYSFFIQIFYWYRQSTYNVTLRRVRTTIVGVEKQ